MATSLQGNVDQGRRTLNTVQRTLRVLLWFILFAVLGFGTLVLAALFGAQRGTPGGILVLVVGGLASLIVPGMITRCLYIVPEFERVVTLKLGKFDGVRGPGQFWVVPYPPFYQSVAAEVDIRVQTHIITAAQTLTADNVPVGCEAVVFWRVEDARRAALDVANYAEAVFQAANSALKDIIGTLELSDLLGERDKIASQLERIIDRASADFGVDVASVEITDIHVPDDLIQELSVLAQSRRAAQAKIAEAEAELDVAQKLEEAASIMGADALEMYRLNVLERMAREEGSQIVIYGLGGNDARREEMLSATAASAMLRKKEPKEE
ncbi:MAG: SPFH domain-containing protein [Chloroflexota bacterium]|nr:SPFH domain-containing protein [Chloroflexota bacterium]